MLRPLPAQDWSLDHAAHLLSRAGFGGTPDQIRAFHALGLDAAVELLISARDTRIAPLGWTSEISAASRPMQVKMAMLSEDGLGAPKDRKMLGKEMRQDERGRLAELRAWWRQRMRASGQPLVEKMTLFWHGHFATSFNKVKSARLMWVQNETLRAHALGDLGAMLRALARDPAMMIWLDLKQSKVGAPNENFAREVMELFTLGVGNYTENDVKEGARAFTGHRIDPRTQESLFARRQHDYGEKSFMGRRGNFDGDAVLGIILEQPACARFVAGRIWEYFAYEKPEPGLLDAVAFSFHRSGHQISPLLAEIFRSASFYSPRATRTHIKSPVEWLVQSCVALETDVPKGFMVDRALDLLGQSLFAPPNVRGWEGGKAWISSSTLVMRYNFASFLVDATGKDGMKVSRRRSAVDYGRIAPGPLRDEPESLAETLAFRTFGTSSNPHLEARSLAAVREISAPATDREMATILQRLMSTPDYQLS